MNSHTDRCPYCWEYHGLWQRCAENNKGVLRPEWDARYERMIEEYIIEAKKRPAAEPVR